MKPSADPEIDRILREPEGDTPRDHLELLCVLSNRITPAGIVCPPPTLGTYALLSCIRSPFLTLPRGRIGRKDIAAALFILSCPKQAAELLRQRAVCEERFSRAAESGGPDPVPVRKTLAQERKFRKEWDRQLRRFERLPRPGEQSLKQAADELTLYLDPGIGFSMLPESDGSDPQAFNLETVARIAAGLAEVMPGTATDRLLWQIPMVEIGMLLVQAARKHGIQGISRDEKTRRLWQRFEQLQNPDGKKARTPERRRGRKAETARRHCSRIHSAADLHSFSVGHEKKQRNEPRIGAARQKTDIGKPVGQENSTSHSSSIFTQQKTDTKSFSVQRETTIQHSCTQELSRKITERKVHFGNGGNQTLKTWTGRADFSAAVPVSASPLQTLTNSVIHIENILKHQLPDSVV